MTVLAASSNNVAPGTLGFLVVAGMGLALFFLFRSMSKQLRKVANQARSEEEASALMEDPGAGSHDGSGYGAPGDGYGTAGDVGAAGRDQRQPG